MTAVALEQGAGLGLDDANALATLFGKRLRLQTETASDAAAAAGAARRLVRDGASVLLGGAGDGTGEALRDAAASGSAVFMNVAALDERLRNEACARHVFHVIPSVTMLVDTLAQWAGDPRRRLRRWQLVGDGTRLSREIESAARRALARHGGALVAATDGADLMLLALQGEAQRDAVARARAEGRGHRTAGLDDELLVSLDPGALAGMWAVGWYHQLVRFSARELNRRFRRRSGSPLATRSWAAWAAVKLVGEAVVRGQATGGPGVIAFLETAPPFDGHKGSPLTFRSWDHQLRQPLYVLGPPGAPAAGAPGGGLVVVSEVPGSRLEAVGTTAGETGCRLGR
jgi:ABC-type branched-subunit amino acid transport system substrate-binding protein